MHIYAFGSLCRGDVDTYSDADLLAIVDSFDPRLDPNMFSIYSYQRVRELWNEGNPFAWHLAAESKLIFSDGEDFINGLGSPNAYVQANRDCEKFLGLFQEAYRSTLNGSHSRVFDLSTIFLSIRNFATCFSLGRGQQNFSRHSALQLGQDSVPISQRSYELLERTRLLSTRAIGDAPKFDEIEFTVKELEKIEGWMIDLVRRTNQ